MWGVRCGEQEWQGLTRGWVGAAGKRSPGGWRPPSCHPGVAQHAGRLPTAGGQRNRARHCRTPREAYALVNEAARPPMAGLTPPRGKGCDYSTRFCQSQKTPSWPPTNDKPEMQGRGWGAAPASPLHFWDKLPVCAGSGELRDRPFDGSMQAWAIPPHGDAHTMDFKKIK